MNAIEIKELRQKILFLVQKDPDLKGSFVEKVIQKIVDGGGEEELKHLKNTNDVTKIQRHMNELEVTLLKTSPDSSPSSKVRMSQSHPVICK